MGLPDKHDERLFRHFAKIDADGHVVATLEVADGQPDPVDEADSLYIDVTELHPYDFAGVKVPLSDVQTAVTSRHNDLNDVHAKGSLQGVELNPFFVAQSPQLPQPSDSTIEALAVVHDHLRDLNKVHRG